MEILEAIHTRRSIRRFVAKPVSEDMIRTLLEAAMVAPSAGNEQPWQFLVITEKEKLVRVTEVHPYVKMAADAPLGILVCGDLNLEKFPGFWVQDCSAAMQNLLLAAHGIGLGAVWTGIYPLQERVDQFQGIFGLPERVIPLGLAVIGWPAQPATRKDRYKSERVHRNVWGA